MFVPIDISQLVLVLGADEPCIPLAQDLLFIVDGVQDAPAGHKQYFPVRVRVFDGIFRVVPIESGVDGIKRTTQFPRRFCRHIVQRLVYRLAFFSHDTIINRGRKEVKIFSAFTIKLLNKEEYFGTNNIFLQEHKIF